MNPRIRKLEEQISNIRKQINEVLASPYPYEISQPEQTYTGYEITSAFTSAASKYTYDMEIWPQVIEDDEPAITAEVNFRDENQAFTVTGKGDAFRVMATVMDITNKILNNTAIIKSVIEGMAWEEMIPDADREPFIDALTFSSVTTEPSRLKLYRRISKSIPGYTFVGERDGDFYLVNNKVDPERRNEIKRTFVS